MFYTGMDMLMFKVRDYMAKSNAYHRKKFLSGTQEVLYQKEFKKADRVYNQLTQKGNRS